MTYVSSSRCLDYRDAAFYEDAAALEQLRRGSMLQPDILASRMIFEAARYRRDAPTVLWSPTADWRGQVMAHAAYLNEHCASTHHASVAVLRNAMVQSNVVCLGPPEQCDIVYESHRPADRAEMAFDAQKGPPPPSLTFRDDSAYLYIGSPGYRNYGHWVVDDLPKLNAIAAIRHWDSRPLVVVIPDAGEVLNRIKQQSLKLLLGPTIPHRMVVVPAERTVLFERLYWVSPTNKSPHYQIPSALNWAGSTARNAITLPNPGTRRTHRLLVVRRVDQGRDIINQAAFSAALAPLGFTEIEPDRLSFDEQVELFARAETVVGTMGAAMASTIFCSPACDLVYLAPLGWQETFYLDIAAVQGQSYAVAYGMPVEIQRPHLSRFTLPAEAIQAVVRHVGP